MGDKNTSIARLRKLLFGAKTEKTAAVVGATKTQARRDIGRRPRSADIATAMLPRAAATDTRPTPAATADSPARTPRPTAIPRRQAKRPSGRQGHGRNGADAYTAAEKIEVPHASLQPGDACPKCAKGTVYDTHRPGVLVRLMGQAPVEATVYSLQKLRCNLCGALHRRAARGRGRGEVRRHGRAA